MSDLISRETAIEAVYEALRTPLPCYGNDLLQDSMTLAKAIVKNIPSVELKQKKGKWIDDGTELGCCCSECGVTLDDYFYGALYKVRLSKMPNFCPNCGVEME